MINKFYLPLTLPVPVRGETNLDDPLGANRLSEGEVEDTRNDGRLEGTVS